MKKIFTFSLCILLFCTSNSQIIRELKKDEMQKVNTKNHEKSLGLDINISYPVDWNKIDGKRPHMLFNFSSPDNSIRSTFGITDILESATPSEKKVFRLLSDKDIVKIVRQNFPNKTNCTEFFKEIGVESPRNSTCRTTKVEGIESSVGSSFGTMRRAESSINMYMVYYQIPYKTKIILIGFTFYDVKDEQERYLADVLSNKIINTIVINNLWKKN